MCKTAATAGNRHERAYGEAEVSVERRITDTVWIVFGNLSVLFLLGVTDRRRSNCSLAEGAWHQIPLRSDFSRCQQDCPRR